MRKSPAARISSASSTRNDSAAESPQSNQGFRPVDFGTPARESAGSSSSDHTSVDGNKLHCIRDHVFSVRAFRRDSYPSLLATFEAEVAKSAEQPLVSGDILPIDAQCKFAVGVVNRHSCIENGRQIFSSCFAGWLKSPRSLNRINGDSLGGGFWGCIAQHRPATACKPVRCGPAGTAHNTDSDARELSRTVTLSKESVAYFTNTPLKRRFLSRPY